IEIARDLGWHVAHLGAETAADLHGERSILHVAADRTGVADADQVLDDDIALESAAHFGAFGLHRAVALAVGVDEERTGGNVAFDVTVDLHLPAVANLALDDRVFPDDQYALMFSHRMFSHRMFSSPWSCARSQAASRRNVLASGMREAQPTTGRAPLATCVHPLQRVWRPPEARWPSEAQAFSSIGARRRGSRCSWCTRAGRSGQRRTTVPGASRRESALQGRMDWRRPAAS